MEMVQLFLTLRQHYRQCFALSRFFPCQAWLRPRGIVTRSCRTMPKHWFEFWETCVRRKVKRAKVKRDWSRNSTRKENDQKLKLFLISEFFFCTWLGLHMLLRPLIASPREGRNSPGCEVRNWVPDLAVSYVNLNESFNFLNLTYRICKTKVIIISISQKFRKNQIRYCLRPFGLP